MNDPERYTILLEQAADGGWGDWSPELPGCVALGDTTRQAVAEMRDAIAFHLEGTRRRRRPDPRADRPRGPGRAELHRRIAGGGYLKASDPHTAAYGRIFPAWMVADDQTTGHARSSASPSARGDT